MTLRQTLQAAPAKTNEIIGKLANTSNQAVKTRESLLEELTSELSLYVDVEEQHLVPLLRKHAGTKSLAADAVKGNRDLCAQLSALGGMAVDNDEFLAKISELKKSFQQHVRDERNELLPAVLKALSDEEASETAANMETTVAEAAAAKRAEKRAEDAATQRAEEVEQAAARASKAAQRSIRVAAEKSAETLQQTATKVQDGAREATRKFAETTEKVASSAREAVTIYKASTEKLAEDLRAISTSSSVASKATSEVGSAWMEWARSTAALNLRSSRQMMQSKSFAEFAQAQKEFAEGAMRTWMEGSSMVLEITQRASKQALNPLQARMEKAN